MKENFEHEYFLEINHKDIKKVSVTVKFIGDHSQPVAEDVYDNLRVSVVPPGKILYDIVAETPCIDFSSIRFKKFFNDSWLEIEKDEFNEIIQNTPAVEAPHE